MHTTQEPCEAIDAECACTNARRAVLYMLSHLSQLHHTTALSNKNLLPFPSTQHYFLSATRSRQRQARCACVCYCRLESMGAEHFYPFVGVDASNGMDAAVDRWIAGLWVPLMRAVANVKVRVMRSCAHVGTYTHTHMHTCFSCVPWHM